MGLKLLNEQAQPSNVVTPILAPEGINIGELRKLMLNKYGVEIAGGQGKLKDKTFRIGHLGNVDPLFVISVLTALELALVELGINLEIGKGVTAAQKKLIDEI